MASEQRIPAVFWGAEIAECGGTWPTASTCGRPLRAADQPACVLKGAKPAEFPVDRTASFELVVNLDAARKPGLSTPPTIVAHADRVIG